MFHLHCLGESCLRNLDGLQVHFRSRKHFALLVYLAVSGQRAHRRERLVGLLWPEDGESRARHSLSQSLYALRRILGDDVIESRGEELQFAAVAPERLRVDALEFDGHLQASRLLEAVEVYRGDFLEGFWIREARPFEEWMDRERARFAAGLRQALRTLIRESRERGEWPEVMGRSRRLIEIEPYDERAYADLMTALWVAGDRAGALKQYEVLREVLAADLDSEPGPEVQELVARIRRRAAEAKRKEGERKAVPAVSEPPFVGRKEEYACLLAIWERVRQGRAAAVVLTGEPGIGKTRLAEEFLKYAELENALILRVPCYQFLQAIPYAAFAEAIRGVIHDELLQKLEPTWRSQLAILFPEVVKWAAPPEERLHELQQGAGTRLQFEAVARLFSLLATRQPVIVFLDNLQWADSGSAALGYFLLQRLPRLSLFLIATSRDQSPQGWLAWPLGAEVRPSFINVTALSRTEVDSLVELTSAQLPSEDIYSFSRGNPFFALELCRMDASEAEGTVGDQSVGARADGGRAILQQRLSLLDVTDRKVLEAASIIGERISLSFLEHVSGFTTEAVVEALERLCRQGFLLGPADQFAFAHDLIHEAVYGSMGEIRRAVLHARVAAYLAAGEDSLEARARCAWHYDRAGDRTRAFACALSAAKEAKQRYAHDQARMLAEVAAKNASAPHERAEATFVLAEVLFEKRRYAGARPLLEECRTTAVELGDRDLELQVANLLWRIDLDSSDRSVRDVFIAAEALLTSPVFGSASLKTKADLLMILFAAACRAADVKAMLRVAEVSEEVAGSCGDPYERIRLLKPRAFVEVVLGKAEKAIEVLRQRVREAQDAGSVREEVDALIDVGVALSRTFAPLDDCREHYAGTTMLSEKLGDPLFRGRSRNNWGATLLDWGYFEEAESQLGAALEILKPFPELSDTRGAVEANLGELCWLVGRYAEAERHWRLAYQVAQTSKHLMIEMTSTAGLGLCAMTTGDKVVAREWCAKALRAVRQYKGQPGEIQDPHLLRAWLILARGEAERAANYVRKVAERLGMAEPASCLKLLLGAARLFADGHPVHAAAFAQELVLYATRWQAHKFEEEGRALLDLVRARPRS